MIYKYALFFAIFIIGELLFNWTWYKYLRRIFQNTEAQSSTNNGKNINKLLFIDISVFKGIMERFILYSCLVINLTSILVVFAAIKIGTRLKDNDNKVKSDYFLIGNLSSIMIAIFYCYLFGRIITY